VERQFPSYTKGSSDQSEKNRNIRIYPETGWLEMKRDNGRTSSLRRGTERASLIARLISWFDSYVELYTVDPVRIERALKSYSGTDLDQIWKSVKSDVDQIVELPTKSQEIEKYSKRASRSRVFSLIIGVFTFAALIIYLYFQTQLKSLGGQDIVIIIPAVMIALLYGFFMLTILSTRSLNKAMRSFYDKHTGELTKQKSHMRDATQQLIDRLSREIYSHGFEPNRFKFQLFHSNYKNISVVGRNGAKFVSTIRPRGQAQK
jgi:hypothetical protein